MREGLDTSKLTFNVPKFNLKKADYMALLERIEHLEKEVEVLKNRKIEKVVKKATKKKASK